MKQVTLKDGTSIAYEKRGEGLALILMMVHCAIEHLGL